MAELNVRVEVDGPFATVTVDRPKSLNALDTRTLQELEKAAADLAQRPDIRGVIVTGAGEKAFVAGADIAEMNGMDAERARHFGALGQRVMDAIGALPVPVVAAVNGFALGGGCELALACDFIYASENARFGLPEVSLGVIPGFGGTQRLTRLVGRARAKELIFTGDMIDAARAREIGLVLDVVPLPRLVSHARATLERAAKKGPLAIRRAKEAIDRGADLELADGLHIEREVFADLFDSADRREGMKAFLEKRPPTFTGR
ncbi:MAG TPA: enoyl-CoA hydratase-related protein [Myxococcaceae bacterium]|nr:enoyl-CoA hydratase-related protein [Myxococcaceae bacterium]